MKAEDKIKEHVDACIEKWDRECGNDFIYLAHTKNTRDHIVAIGTSILCTKFGVGFPGGSFVQAVVDNKLAESLGRADNINRHCLLFYTKLLYNSILEDILGPDFQESKD